MASRSRYSVHLQPDQRGYCVWDNESSRIATSPDGREYGDLSVGNAFKTADGLNAENEILAQADEMERRPAAAPQQTEHAAQQQQQPQPDDPGKE
jgi:hypothetical protein